MSCPLLAWAALMKWPWKNRFWLALGGFLSGDREGPPPHFVNGREFRWLESHKRGPGSEVRFHMLSEELEQLVAAIDAIRDQSITPLNVGGRRRSRLGDSCLRHWLVIWLVTRLVDWLIIREHLLHIIWMSGRS